MEITIDIIKQIRETIDWIKKQFEENKDKTQRKKLERVINDISDLVSNKNEYLRQIKNAAKGDDLDNKIKSALDTAQKDTEKLLLGIKETGLNANDITLRLKTKFDQLANFKLSEIERLNLYFSGNDNIDKEKIVETLSGFESQWLEIGEEIEKLKAAK